MNPAWEYRLYDDDAIEAFLLAHYDPAVRAAYQRIDPSYGAARADLFRYLVIYKLGGVYIDIKSRFLRPIDEVLRGDEAFLLSQWSNGPGQIYEGFGLKPEVARVPRHRRLSALAPWNRKTRGHPFDRSTHLYADDRAAGPRSSLHCGRQRKRGGARLQHRPRRYAQGVVQSPLHDQHGIRGETRAASSPGRPRLSSRTFPQAATSQELIAPQWTPPSGIVMAKL
jgi:hypothetical protein